MSSLTATVLNSRSPAFPAKRSKGPMAENLVDSIAPARPSATDAAGLAAALRANLRGEIRFDNGARALYATDGSNYRQVPIGVVLPYNTDDVLAAIATCREFGAPVLCRGGGTSLAGQCC